MDGNIPFIETPYFTHSDQDGFVQLKRDFCFILFSEASLSCRLLKLEATILMRFSAVRQVGLFFGAAYSTAECSWQACGISARHCLASTFGGHTRSSRSYFFFWAIAEALFQTCIHGRMQSCLRTLLICFYQSVSQSLWVVLSYIFPLQS